MKKFFTYVCCFLFLMNTAVFAAPASAQRVKVLSFAGDVRITPPGEAVSAECAEGMHLNKGARVVTGRESFLEIGFDRRKENIVVVEADSDVVIKLDGPDKIELVSGEIFALLRGLKKGETFRVRTPCAVCGARGTGWKTSNKNGTTEVAVFDDKTFVRGMNKDGTPMEEEKWVHEGFMRSIRKFRKPGKMQKLSEEQLAKLRSRFGQEAGKKKAPKKPKKGKKKGKKRGEGQNKKRGLFSMLFGKVDKKVDFREKRWKSAMDHKTEDRLDKIRDDKKDEGCSESRGAYVIEP